MTTVAVPSNKGRAHFFPDAPRPLPALLKGLGSHDGSDAAILELWRAERSVRDYIDTPPGRRSSLAVQFPQPKAIVERSLAAGLQAPELQAVFRLLQAVARFPQDADAAGLAAACHRAALWLERHGNVELAVRLAEDAAGLDPTNPRWANLAGRLHRLAGSWFRSDVWFWRGVGLARRAVRAAGTDAAEKRKHEEARIRGYLGWGTLWANMGLYRRALWRYGRAGCGAQRSGIKWLAAMVHHDMFVIATAMGEFEPAERYARRALRTYPVHHVRLPALGYDLAILLMWRDMHVPALTMLEGAVGKFAAVYDRGLALSALARAAGGASIAHRYEGARDEALAAVARDPTRGAATLLNIAFGARSLMLWDEARELAAGALAMARKRGGHHEEERKGARLLEEVASKLPPPPARGIPDGPAGSNLRMLVGTMEKRLSAWRGPTWRRKSQAGPGDVGEV